MLADVIDATDVRMRDLAGDAHLVLEPGQPDRLLGDDPRQEFQGDGAVDDQIVGAIDLAHPAAPQQRDNSKSFGNHRPRVEFTVGVVGGRSGIGRGFGFVGRDLLLDRQPPSEAAACRQNRSGAMFGQQRFHLAAQMEIVTTYFIESLASFVLRDFQNGQKCGADLGVAFRAHGWILPSSRRSQALACVHSPSTVRFETPRTRATWSTVIPPKKRSSTTRAWRGSIALRLCRASLSATRSTSPPSVNGAMASSSSTLCQPPPRFARRRLRA